MPGRTPISQRIAAELRADIRSGVLGPGQPLPSERDLIDKYGTSKSTASKVIGLLLAEGLVTTEFGKGTYVRRRPPLRRVSAARRHAEHRSSGKPIFDTEAIGQGQVPTRQMLAIGRAEVPPYAAAWLKTQPGEQAVIRKRLQLLDGEPAVVSTSYYPLWLAAGTRLELPGALPEGPDALIETLGHRFSRGIEVFRVRMPTQEESALLHLPPGTPVVLMWDVDYDEQGRALQAAEDIYAGDKHEFFYEWTEEDIPK
jgi:GntR family transcriptional regulator